MVVGLSGVVIAVRVFIGGWRLSVRFPKGYCGHVTVEL
jgi:hypothetical protein